MRIDGFRTMMPIRVKARGAAPLTKLRGPSLSMDLYLVALVLAAWLAVAHGRHNITVDDQDPSIVYSGSWAESANSSLDFGGAHMLTQDPSATASFTFTGIAIYFMSPLWPYTVNTAISLDGADPVLVDLVDHSQPSIGQGPETVQSAVVWSAGGLSNASHTLIMSVGLGQPFAIVDGLIYTALDSEDLTSSLSPSSTSFTSSTTTGRIVASATTSGSSSTPTTSGRVLPIALGTVLGVLGLLLVAVAFWFCARRRKRPVSEAWTVEGPPYSPSLPAGAPPVPFSPQTGGQYIPGQRYDQGYSSGQTGEEPWQSRFGYDSTPMMVGVGAGAASRAYAGGYDPYQTQWSGVAPPPQPANRAPNRAAAQVNTLSTITESSTPPFAEGRTPLANSPVSNPSELGYYTPQTGGGSERISSVPSAARSNEPSHQTSYYGGEQEPIQQPSMKGSSRRRPPVYGQK